MVKSSSLNEECNNNPSAPITPPPNASAGSTSPEECTPSPIPPVPPQPPVVVQNRKISNNSRCEASDEGAAMKSEVTKGAHISPAALRGVKPNDCKHVSPQEIVDSAIKRFINFNQEYRCHSKEVFNHSTQPQLQEGPQCGLVALSMASRLFGKDKHISPSFLMNEAKKQEFTKQGEMFSCANLLSLCYEHVTEEVELCSIDRLNDPKDICQDFITNHIYLFPYDCDFSHGPCLAEGRKAHWALITGFVMLSHSGYDPDKAFWIRPEEFDPEQLRWKRIKLFGRQSKSLVQGIWEIDELIASNKNLKIVDDKRDPKDYIIPPEGIESGLANQFIKIKIRNSETLE
eukprot:TRINITY_DN2114_c0_g2_i3.p1 TRINITY_DN2114_c0_g2~~TRINITY_DN2114_c0_g2_i3.p1  ORF type:complete len:345 (+),score=45.75 TRINITY_DN2114_c0_g2_i3:77-1111(+)